ncbi:MAG: fumarylacetoacetase [Symbiobacteriaceae bacterium]|jgi:fumarylacetoacetate (FAA) hydrolase|nr:fumarylacetoacetase [Symbiobacteriaceae bacterium]
MRLVTVSVDKVLRPGRLHDDGVMVYAATRMQEVVGEPGYRREMGWVPAPEVRLRPPVPHPQTIRDFYAFEAHVKNARARRGLGMIPEWYNAPVFYFSNTTNVFGPDEEIRRPSYTKMLDFELEVAAVIGKIGYNIDPDDAEQYIAGFMIMNDWSARDVQREEMKVGLGPAKGKDFATSFGPWILTTDELADRRVGPGLRYNLEMVARINGKEVSRGNLADMHFHWGELLARASQDCMLQPGEIIGSGTVGTGCLLETGAAPWLEPGDEVELEVERLGVLRNLVR